MLHSSEMQQLEVSFADMDMGAVERLYLSQRYRNVASICVYKKIHMALWTVGAEPG